MATYTDEKTQRIIEGLMRICKLTLDIDQKLVIIMRGLPGSGKSFIVKKTMEEMNKLNISTTSCSTDDLFNVDGKYTFDASKLKDNHQRNLEIFTQNIKDGVQVIFVDNTNVAKFEYSNYSKVAKSSDEGYIVTICEVPEATNVQLCLKRNTHGVDRDVLERRYRQYEIAKPVYVGSFYSMKNIRSRLPEKIIQTVEDDKWSWISSPHITFDFCAQTKDCKWRASQQWEEENEFGSKVVVHLTELFQTKNTLSLHGKLVSPKPLISAAYANTQSVHITVAVRTSGLAVESGIVYDRLCRNLGAEEVITTDEKNDLWDTKVTCADIIGLVKHVDITLDGTFMYMF